MISAILSIVSMYCTVLNGYIGVEIHCVVRNSNVTLCSCVAEIVHAVEIAALCCPMLGAVLNVLMVSLLVRSNDH